MGTKEELYFKAMYFAQQKLGISTGIMKMIYEKLNNCKRGFSKIDGKNMLSKMWKKQIFLK